MPHFKIPNALTQYPLLLTAFLIVLIAAYNRKEINDGFEYTVAAVAVACIVFHFLLSRKAIRGNQQGLTKIIRFEELEHDLRQRQGGFLGTLKIANVELNTLQNFNLWEGICENPRFREIAIALPAHIFKRFETILEEANGEGISAVFSKHASKIKIYAVTADPGCRNTAFALFDHELPDQDFCYVFLKSEPFSRCEMEDGGAEHWSYESFLSLEGNEVKAFKDCFNQLIQDRRPFSIAEVLEFIEGGNKEPGEVAKYHGLEGNDHAAFVQLYEESGINPVVSSGQNGTVVKLNSNRTAARLEYDSTDTTIKPALLWMPPWGRSNWRDEVSQLDSKLSTTFRVFHLVQSDREYTFSGSEMLGEQAIQYILTNDDSLRVERGSIFVIGVSVNAFVAACLGAKRSEVHGLCLLAPAIDLFDAVDAFREVRPKIELFTRNVYFAKQGYRAQGMNEEYLDYFGKKTRPSHLLDLRVRGSRACRKATMLDNLEKITNRGTRVLIGHCPYDEMTPRAMVQSLVNNSRLDPNAVNLVDVDWVHDLRSRNGFVCASGIQDSPPLCGVGGIVNFMRKCYETTRG